MSKKPFEPRPAEPLPLAIPRSCRASVANGLVIALAVATLCGCSRPRKSAPTEPQLLVFAAASLRDALTEVGQSYERHASGTTVAFSFAGSNALARQLIAAPRADLYLSASDVWMDRVEQAGVIEPGSRRTLLGNQLVLIVHRDADPPIAGVCDLVHAKLDHLVLGNPEVVPAGVYAKQYLTGVDCPGDGNAWAALESKVLATPDVRAALAQVEASRRVAAFTYRTDALTSSRVRIVFAAPTAASPRIRYSAALVRNHAGPEPQRFLEYLTSPAAKGVFERHGFVSPPP